MFKSLDLVVKADYSIKIYARIVVKLISKEMVKENNRREEAQGGAKIKIPYPREAKKFSRRSSYGFLSLGIDFATRET